MPMLVAASAGSLTTWGLLLAVAALVAWWAQARRRAPDGIRRQTVSLGGQHALHVVELEGRRLLLGTGPGAAPRLVTELEPLSEVPTGPQDPAAGSSAGADGR